MPPVTDIESFCRSRLAGMLDIDPAGIESATTFASLGLDSAAAVHFVLEVEQEYGVELYPGVTQDYPSVIRFAEYLTTLKQV
ncbi:MAG TPA: acyl carrier protein [Bosea sp. (in: a-proteobacteria)]|jgi:acyl carrier protein|uniref:acyl carrier protein n=1 Tax=Bosea sp. (in: a-proteobacteria) TaxID=1871050 RepID=UPI002E10E41B|nr:acyl carrier protein [Bosea sp. (in: a-proteobacteria)]